jgi:hypothetical protein
LDYKPKSQSLEVIDGDRAQLEEKIVEDIFLNRYDPAKAALLKRRGRLVAVPKERAKTEADCG